MRCPTSLPKSGVGLFVDAARLIGVGVRKSVQRPGAMTKIHAWRQRRTSLRPASHCEGWINWRWRRFQQGRRASHSENAREKNLSAQQDRAQAPSRISCAHGDCRRPQRHRRAPGARPQAPVGLRPNGLSTKSDGRHEQQSPRRIPKRRTRETEAASSPRFYSRGEKRRELSLAARSNFSARRGRPTILRRHASVLR